MSFADVMFHATGTAHIEGLNGMVNEDFMVDSTDTGDFAGRFIGFGGTVTFDQLAIDPINEEIDPDQLPDGVTALSVEIDTNLANVVYEGLYSEIVYPLGDLNHDQVVDLTDYDMFESCLGGPDVFAPPAGARPTCSWRPISNSTVMWTWRITSCSKSTSVTARTSGQDPGSNDGGCGRATSCGVMS